MSLASWVSPENLHFEHSLLQDPDNETTWLDYADLVSGNTAKSDFVLNRAVTRLPASTLLWNAYFLLPWSDQDDSKVIAIYKRALVSLGSSPAVVTRYLDLLARLGSDSDLRMALDAALFRLDPKYHGPVWKTYLEYADRVGGSSGARIYMRYFPVCGQFADGPQLAADDVVLRVVALGQFELAIVAYDQLWTGKRLSRMPSVVATDFLDALEADLAFGDDEYFQLAVQRSIVLFPDMECVFLLKWARFCERRGKSELAVHGFTCALKAANSVAEATSVLDQLAVYLEETNAELNAPPAAQNHSLDIYEKLLDDRALYINDVQLKQNIDLVDVWLDRIAILHAKDRKPEMLTTYVSAITSINPLRATSAVNNSMATIWIHYANVYIDQGDVDTANVIFSRAIKSQFKTTNELVDIHLAWAELMLEKSDDAALAHIMALLKVDTDPHPDPLQLQLARSPRLWEFRLDLLRAISANDKSLQNPQVVLGDMIATKVVTLRILLNYAADLKEESLWDQYFAALEMGLAAFVLPEARAEIWNQYLPEYVARNTSDKDKIRDTFEKCLAQVPAFQAKAIYVQYAQFEQQNGLISKSVRILRQAVARLTTSYDENIASYSKAELNQIADDKVELYTQTVDIVTKYLKDSELCREVYTKAVEDRHLTTPNIIQLCLRFIDFEISNKEFARVRALFKYAGGLSNPQQHMAKPVWKAWEEFEVEHGSEDAYKQMLKYKRQIAKEFEGLEEAKSSINPMGFTKASSVVAKQAANPDAIELDMDM